MAWNFLFLTFPPEQTYSSLALKKLAACTHIQLLDDPAALSEAPGGPDPGEGDAERSLRVGRGHALEVKLRRVVQEGRGEAVRVEDRGEIHHVGFTASEKKRCRGLMKDYSGDNLLNSN